MGFGDIVGGVIGGVTGAIRNRQGEKAQNQMSDDARSAIGRARALIGYDPKAMEQTIADYKDLIRAAQADRGIFQSGPALKQESYLMPQILQQLKQMQFSQLLDVANSYRSPAGIRATGTSMGVASGAGWGMAGKNITDAGMAGAQALMGMPSFSSLFGGGEKYGPGY